MGGFAPQIIEALSLFCKWILDNTFLEDFCVSFATHSLKLPSSCSDCSTLSTDQKNDSFPCYSVIYMLKNFSNLLKLFTNTPPPPS